MLERKKKLSVLMIVLLCVTVMTANSTLAAGSHLLPVSAETLTVGGSCSSFASGVALGMGIATLLGCGWCPVGALAAKVVSVYVC